MKNKTTIFSNHQSIIDKWICKDTNGMVTKVQPLPAIYIDVIVNVIYMKDKWKHQKNLIY